MRLAIFGTGGFAREIIKPAVQYVEKANERALARGDLELVADDPSDPVFGLEVIRPEALEPDYEIVIALGSSPSRQAVAERLSHLRAGRVIAPSSVIGPEAEIGEGAVFCDFTMVTASARIGRHFQCNIYSYVAHDCVIGDFVTFAPRVCCNGNVHIEDGAYVGTGAVLKQGTLDKPLVIGAGAIVGMGAVVTKNVAPGVTVVGNPARRFETA